MTESRRLLNIIDAAEEIGSLNWLAGLPLSENPFVGRGAVQEAAWNVGWKAADTLCKQPITPWIDKR